MGSRLARLVAAATALALAVSLTVDPATATPPSVEPSLDVEVWASGIISPWDVAFLPDGDALITEKTTGLVWVREPDGTQRALDMDQPDFTAPGEGGLMGLVVDPDVATNGKFYTCQNSTQGDVRVVRWRLNADRTSAVRQRVVVDDIVMTSGRHSGCRLRFGYEGYLWITTGDAADASAPQSLNSLGGKVLRVDPKNGRGHPDNPFFTSAGADRSKIYSYGHRNPQGIDRRPCTDQMWAGEHGPSWDDEINLLQSGGNYGWNPGPGYDESTNRQNMTDTGLPGSQIQPRFESGTPTIALSGIGWIRGADWGAWDGELAGATLRASQLWIFEFNNKNRLTDTDIPAELDGTGRLRTAVMGPDGSLYVPNSSAAQVWRITPAAGPAPGSQDVNGDGFDDLVVGTPSEDFGSKDDAGAFTVLFGSVAGLDPTVGGSDLRSQRNVRGESRNRNDGFGSAVAYGDIDGDGITDVVVGAPGEDVSGSNGAGAVTVICGRTNGLAKRSSQTFSQAGSVAGSPQAGDAFGDAVAMGDFNGDGLDDVVVGVPGEDAGGSDDTGAVTVLYGTPAGLRTEKSKTFTQAGRVGGTPDAGDRFGAALATGDFDGDGYDDVAVGIPFEDVDGRSNAGAVTIIFGTEKGLRSRDSQHWTQLDLPGDNASGDRFGAALAAADFDGDGRDDLAIGAPREDVDGADNAGSVTVVFGGPDGLVATGSQSFSESLGDANPEDQLGYALAAGDFDGDGDPDLVAGAPGQGSDHGGVQLYRNDGGELVDRGGDAVAEKRRARDRVGASLRAGDFDADGFVDLAVGIPGRDADQIEDSGAIAFLHGSASGLNGEAEREIAQGTSGVQGQSSTGDRWGSAL